MPRSPVTWEQTAAGWRNLPAAARTSVLVVAALAVGASTFFLVEAPKPTGGDYLFDGRQLAASQRAMMEAAWSKHHLSGYEIEAGRVRVPAGEAAKYLAALAESEALPADFGAELETKYGNLNPFLSTAARLESLRLAKQNFLAKIIGEMPDVDDAWVVVDSKSSGGLRRDEKTTASATVRGREGAPIALARLTQIQRLIASAVAGLDPRDVAVIDLASPDGAPLNSPVSAGDDEYLQRVQAYQQYYRGLIREALAFVPGSTATVNVELDRRVREVHERQSFETPPPGAQQGDAAIWSNVGRVALATFEGPGAIESPGLSRLAPNGLHYQERQRVEQVGLTPSRVSVSVTVPEDHFASLWRRQLRDAALDYRAPTPEERQALEAAEIDKIRRVVATVLPNVTSEEQARALIAVHTFARGEHEPEVGHPKPTASNAAGDALAPWPVDARLIGAVSAAVLAFLLASTLFRSAPAPTTPDEPEEETPPAPKGEPLRGPHTPRSVEAEGIEDHLRRRVDEDPEAALGVLRDWLHRGEGRQRRSN